MFQDLGFKFQGAGFSVQGSVQGAAFRIWGAGFRAQFFVSFNPKPWVLKLVDRTAGTPGNVRIKHGLALRVQGTK